MKSITTTLLSGLLIAATNAAPSDAERLFTLKVGPLLSLKCNGCHGDDAEKIKGDLNMLTREGLLEGGSDIGSEVLVPGHADKSFLMTAIRWEDPDFEMPPKGERPPHQRADRAGRRVDQRRRALAGRQDAASDPPRRAQPRGDRGRRDPRDQWRTRRRLDLPPLPARGGLGVPTGRKDRSRQIHTPTRSTRSCEKNSQRQRSSPRRRPIRAR